MKVTRALIVSFFAASQLFAQAPEAPAPAEAPTADKPIPDVYPRWSIVGDWQVTNPDWTDTVTFRADGTHSTSRGSAGRWFFASDRGELVLVLRWDLFGTESLTMVTPDHFRGQKKKGRFIDMRRGDAAQKPAAEPK